MGKYVTNNYNTDMNFTLFYLLHNHGINKEFIYHFRNGSPFLETLYT